MSGRDPSTWILRDAGNGATAAESTFASRAKNWSLAFMANSSTQRREEREEGHFTLPCAGIIRIRFQGFHLTRSPHWWLRRLGPLASVKQYHIGVRQTGTASRLHCAPHVDRRSMSSHPVVRFANVEWRPGQRLLLVDGAPVKTGARALDLLNARVERRDRIVRKDELLDIVWPGIVVEEANLHVQVSALRKLLGPVAIATIPGRGYRFVAIVDGDDSDARPAPAPASARTQPGNLPAATS